MSTTTIQPWYVDNDTIERNEKARKAYSALLTITTRQPDDEEYRQFSKEVKSLAREKYNYTYAENETISTIITSFYDAVFLYAYALNDTIHEMGEQNALHLPINGSRLARLMWNRSFRGITGNVTIDANGDRISDYSLFDMNPETGYFELVANYYHDNGLQYIEGRSIHWAGDREFPPLDKPICGFDNSLCPDTSLPGYAILSIVLSVMVVIMVVVSFLGYRHYKLEAEINSMTWKIQASDITPCNNKTVPGQRQRGSIYSLAKRGSQVVRVIVLSIFAKRIFSDFLQLFL